ncbi:3-hydroxyacyl-CoA dehydrogenase NAD-binding domain-containing protein [Altericroceibacterium spongiae]
MLRTMSAPTLARIRTAVDLGGFSDCDLVIEVVFEAMDVKRPVLNALIAATKPDYIASNISTIPISTLAGVSRTAVESETKPKEYDIRRCETSSGSALRRSATT